MSDAAITIRLPEDVAAELARLAREDGVTPEEMLVRMTKRHVGSIRSAKEFFAERAKGADWEAFDRVFGLNRQGGEPLRPGDEVD